MIKTTDAITDVIHKDHPFRQVANRPEKPQKRRYERRKVKQCISSSDWASETQS